MYYKNWVSMNNPEPRNKNSVFSPYNYKVRSKEGLIRDFKDRNTNFIEVLLARKSELSTAPPTKIEIAELLYLATKIREISIDETGFIHSKRTTPSAGARHPIDILVSLPEPTNRVLSYYNPLDHSLNELDFESEILNNFLKEVDINSPIENSCLIWFSIQTTKTSSKYLNPESLYWKDTGALLYCIQLIAAYLGLKSCPIGTLAHESFNTLFKDSKICSGGGMLIGK